MATQRRARVTRRRNNPSAAEARSAGSFPTARQVETTGETPTISKPTTEESDRDFGYGYSASKNNPTVTTPGSQRVPRTVVINRAAVNNPTAQTTTSVGTIPSAMNPNGYPVAGAESAANVNTTLPASSAIGAGINGTQATATETNTSIPGRRVRVRRRQQNGN